MNEDAIWNTKDNICREAGGTFIDCFSYDIQSLPFIEKVTVLIVFLLMIAVFLGVVMNYAGTKAQPFFVALAFGSLLLFAFYVYMSNSPEAESVGYQHQLYNSSKAEIDYAHSYIEENKDTDNSIEKKSYTLSYDDFERDTKRGAFQIYTGEDAHGYTPVDVTADDGEALQDKIYPEVTCSDREDAKLTGYYVHADVMIGFPEGFYSAALDIPEDMEACEEMQGEENIFEEE